MTFFAALDGMGVTGNFYHYSMVIAFVGSAFLIFLFLWGKKRLDMDESPKYQMLLDDEIRSEIKTGEKTHES